MTQLPTDSPEAAKARRRRSIAIAIALLAFVAMVFVVTLVRVANHVPTSPY